MEEADNTRDGSVDSDGDKQRSAADTNSGDPPTDSLAVDGTGPGSDPDPGPDSTPGPNSDPDPGLDSDGSIARRSVLAGLAILGLSSTVDRAAAASTSLEFGGNYTGDPGSNYGLRLDPSNARFGLLGFSDASDGRGVVGRATSSSGTTIGVIGRSDSSSDGAAGLMGFNDASSGRTYGFKGRSDSSEGRGALGIATADSGNTIGLEGRADSPDGVAVSGTNTAGSGTTYGVRGSVNSPEGYGLYTPDDANVEGTLNTTGAWRVLVDGDRGFSLGSDAAGFAGHAVLGHASNGVRDGARGGTIGGGGFDDGSEIEPNEVYDDFGTVSGGRGNVAGDADGDPTIDRYATVGGGLYNRSRSQYAVVAGGSSNVARAIHSAIGGGWGNEATGLESTVGGGQFNSVSGYASTIGGGYANAVHDRRCTVGGGRGNVAGTDDGDPTTAQSATVGGGRDNEASGSRATVGGGLNNTASDVNATVGGGRDNVASLNATTVAGGTANIASDLRAAVGGGSGNVASAQHATVGGGSSNTAGARASTVGGGNSNSASGVDSTVGGGDGNVASGGASTIPGGFDNLASGQLSFAAGSNAEAGHDNTFVWSDGADVSSTGAGQFLINADGGVGIGTDDPLTPLHVQGSIDASAAFANHVVGIENTSTGSDADVLALKTNTADPGAANNYVTFVDGDGPVGSIEGDGAGGVNYTSGGADFAEYFPKADPDRTFDPGQVVGLRDGEIVQAVADADTALVVSTAPMITGNRPAAVADDRHVRVALLGQVPVAVAGSVDAGDVLVADPEEDGTAIARRSVAPTALPVVGLALDDSDGGTTDTVTALVGAGGLVRERDTAPADIRTAAGHAPNEPLHAAREAEQERLTALEAETEELREHVAALEAENDALRERNDALETRFEAVEDHLGLDGTGDQSTPADD